MTIKKTLTIVFALLSISGPQLLLGQNHIQTARNSLAKRGIQFVQNKGQVSDQYYRPRQDVLYYGRSGDLFFRLREDGISYQQVRVDSWTDEYDKFAGTPAGENMPLQKVPDQMTIQRTDINWLGINDDYTIETGEVLPGYNNYYLAVCYEGVTGVRAYEQLTYKNLYNGIDLRWYDHDGQLEYDFLVQPGTDYRQIRWTIEGTDSLYINESGELVMRNALGEIREAHPVAFQQGKQMEVEWQLEGQQVGFKLGAYDPELPLLIDPVVRVWGTYFGGTGLEYLEDCHTDGSKAVVASGWTGSLSLIAFSGAFQSTFNGVYDVFIAKFDLEGNHQWSTYLGGTATEHARNCVVDGSGNVFIVGQTQSDSLLASPGAHQTVRSGLSDCLLAKFSPSGQRLWVTYYGGIATDVAWGCDVDAAGNLYFTGYTYSDSLIASSGAFQSSLTSSSRTAFLAKMSGGGSRVWGTYLGATNTITIAYDCAVDAAGNMFVAAYVSGSNSLSTAGAHQTTASGMGDCLLAKFNAQGVRQWSTYYGGPAFDSPTGCAVDDSGNVYMCGYGYSTSGIAQGGHQNFNGGGYDAFLAKFNTGGVLQWGTYYGGVQTDFSWFCAAGDSSTIYLTGKTSSVTDIATRGSYQTSYAGADDAFLVKFDHKGARRWGTYYGGTSGEWGRGCTVDDKQKVYLGGHTFSSNMATVGAYQTINNGFMDGYLVKFSTCYATFDTIAEVVCKDFTSPSGIYTWNASGTYQDTLQNAEGCDSVLTINLTITPAPVLTSVTPATLCDSGSVLLAASASQGTIRWYTDTTSGPTSLVGTGRQFNTPVLDSTMVYYAELTDTAQCASYFVPVEATVNYSSSAAISEEACLRYKTPSGRHVFDTSGFYMDTITNAAGCDSVLSIDLVVKTVDATATQKGMTLEANEPFGLYQWVDCNNNYSALTGNSSFNRQYQVTKNGSYAVIVTKNGCQDTSACFNINYVGLEANSGRPIQLYPNPTKGEFTLDLGDTYENVQIELINTLGQVIHSWNFEQANQLSLMITQPTGQYLLKASIGGEYHLFRIVKE